MFDPALVSVVLTAHNQPEILSVVLGLLSEQAYASPWELIVCDDGSEEDSLSVVRRAFRNTRAHVRYIWQPGKGRRAHSRNNGLRCASGSIVIWLDGDLAVGTDFIERHVAHHTGARTAVYGSRRWLFLGDLPPGAPLALIARELLRSPGSNPRLYSERGFQQKYSGTRNRWVGCMGCNFSFRREEPVLCDERFVGWGLEDQEFACRLQERQGYALEFDPSIWGLHLENSRSTEFTPIRLRTPEEIRAYLRSNVHFVTSYPECDMSPIRKALGFFEVDPQTGEWKRTIRPDFTPERIDALFFQAARDISTQTEGR